MENKKGLLKKCFLLMAMGMLMGMLMGTTATASGATKIYSIREDTMYRKENQGDRYLHKITITESGYIGIQAYGTTSKYGGTSGPVKIGLLNSKGKSLEKYYRVTSSEKKYAIYYGVKKGTYYIDVNPETSAYYRLKYAFKAVSEKSGSSQSAASAIQKNTVRYGLLAAGESRKKSDWYKFTFNDVETITLTMNAVTNGGNVIMQIKIPGFKIKGKSFVQYPLTNGEVKKVRYRLASEGNKISGVGYIRVFRMNKDSSTSGVYSLSWK